MLITRKMSQEDNKEINDFLDNLWGSKQYEQASQLPWSTPSIPKDSQGWPLDDRVPTPPPPSTQEREFEQQKREDEYFSRLGEYPSSEGTPSYYSDPYSLAKILGDPRDDKCDEVYHSAQDNPLYDHCASHSSTQPNIGQQDRDTYGMARSETYHQFNLDKHPYGN